MKKVLTVLMIAVLAAGFVFATVSGNVRFDAKYNTVGKVFTFDPAATINVNLNLGESVAKAGEGDVYATVAVDAKLLFGNTNVWKEGEDGKLTTDGTRTYGIGFDVDFASAAIVGKDWKVNFTMSKYSPVDFAKSAIDTYYDGVKDIFDQYYDYKKVALTMDSGFVKNKKGIEVEAFGAKFGVDFAANSANKDVSTVALPFAYKIYAISPAFGADGFTAQVGAAGELTANKSNSKETTWNLGATVGYAYDAFSANVAADVKLVKDFTLDTKTATNFDIAGKVAYDFVSADIYYVSALSQSQYGYHGGAANTLKLEKYMSARVAANFATFGVPVTFAAQATDLLDKNAVAMATANSDSNKYNYGRQFKFTVSYTGVVNASAWASFIYHKNFKYGASVAYVAPMFTAKAGFEGVVYADKVGKGLMPSVEVSSDKLVSGAVLSFGWYNNTADTYGCFEGNTSNLLEANKSTGKWDLGFVRARVQINF